MATEVKLPRLGQGMESGTIVRWLKAEGDAVEANEPLYELDTDKVTQEVESEVTGVLLRIVVQEGETEVGTTIAVIGSDSNDVTVEDAPTAAEDAEPAPAAAPASAAPAPATEASPPTGNGSAPEQVAPSPGARVKAYRWLGGSRVSAGSSFRRLPEPGPTAGSSPRTWSARPSAARLQWRRSCSLRRARTSR